MNPPPNRYRCHRNLNAPKGAVEWSVSPVFGEHKHRVVGYVSAAEIQNVRFIVRQSGLRRIRSRACREVVAWVEGELVAGHVTRVKDHRGLELPPLSDSVMDINSLISSGFAQVRLDVYRDDSFVYVNSGDSIDVAARAVLTRHGKCFAPL